MPDQRDTTCTSRAGLNCPGFLCWTPDVHHVRTCLRRNATRQALTSENQLDGGAKVALNDRTLAARVFGDTAVLERDLGNALAGFLIAGLWVMITPGIVGNG
jgi:hypothetical protein